MLTFALAVILLIVTPGPGVLSAAGMGAAYGFRPGLRFVLGLFIGNNLVILAVVSGLAALILATPAVRTVLFAASTAYLLYLAARIALAGSRIAFIQARKPPGVLTGFLLQPINPKAYVVNTTLFSGFVLWPEALWTEALFKLIVVNAVWVPVHLLWLYGGVTLERLDLPERRQRAINIGMAAAMLGVVGLAAWSALRG